MRITCVAPYDFRLSWRMFTAFSGSCASSYGALAAWWEEKSTLLNLRQTSEHPPVVEVIAHPLPRRSRLVLDHMRQILHADLDLKPFYQAAEKEPRLREVIADLKGLKPVRPPDIFHMLVIALSEQQVSMTAALAIRERIISSFGTAIGRLTAFPRPETLSAADIRQLRSCGLSLRKAESLRELARLFASGEIDPEAWKEMEDRELVELLTSLPGVGQWTAEYVLLRGLGRLDVVPGSDLGVRRAVGAYLAGGGIPSAGEVHEILRPWSPWRGLAAFYLLAHQRRSQMGLDQAQ